MPDPNDDLGAAEVDRLREEVEAARQACDRERLAKALRAFCDLLNKGKPPAREVAQAARRMDRTA